MFPKSRLKSAKSTLPVDVRRSKTWLACEQALLIGRAKRCSQTKTSLLKFPHFPKIGKTSSSKTNQLIRDSWKSREERKKERFSSVPPPIPPPPPPSQCFSSLTANLHNHQWARMPPLIWGKRTTASSLTKPNNADPYLLLFLRFWRFHSSVFI